MTAKHDAPTNRAPETESPGRAVKAQVLVSDVPAIRARLEKLNRRARKLGVPEVALEIGPESDVEVELSDGHRALKHVVEVSVPRQPVCLSGWRLLGVVDRSLDEPVLRVIPPAVEGVDVRPLEARSGECDHCGTARRRSETFIVYRAEDAALKLVGRQCLADFLGHDVAGVLWAADASAEIDAMLDEYGSGWGGRGEVWYRTDEMLHWTAALIRTDGWVSRRKAETGVAPATADLVIRCMEPPSSFKRPEILPADVERADAALAWAQELEGDAPDDYLRSLGRVARCASVPPRFAGLLCSAVAAHTRALGREIERAQAAAESHHVGEVGQRFKWVAATKRKPAVGGLTLTVEGLVDLESAWGSKTLVRFVDAAGNRFVWFKSGGATYEVLPTAAEDEEWRRMLVRSGYAEEEAATYHANSRWVGIEIGSTYRCDGTVERHDEYKGVAQTVLSRVKIHECIAAVESAAA